MKIGDKKFIDIKPIKGMFNVYNLNLNNRPTQRDLRVNRTKGVHFSVFYRLYRENRKG